MWAGEVEGFEWGELLVDEELGFEALQHLKFVHIPELLVGDVGGRWHSFDI